MPSKGLAECWNALRCSSTGGGKYAWFLAPKASRGGFWGEESLEDAKDDVDDEKEGESDHSVDDCEDDDGVGDCGARVVGSSIPSISPSMTSLS